MYRRSYVALLLCFLCLSTAVAEEARLPGSPGTIDINTADAVTLAERLPGIGPVKARAIIDYRDTHGGFRSVDALIEVRGIGPKTLSRLRPLLHVGKRWGAGALHDPERAVSAAIREAIRTAKRDSRTVELTQGVDPDTQSFDTPATAERR